MADSPKPWSTPKFVLLALLTTFGIYFIGNGVCNELLELGVPSWVFSVLANLALFALILRWRVFRRAIADADKNDAEH